MYLITSKLPQLKSYVIRSRYVSQWDFEDLKDAVNIS